MAAPESHAEQIIECLRSRLQAVKAGSGYWYTPDRVARFQEFRDHWFRETSWQTLYLLAPGFERATEQATGQIDFDLDVTIVCLRAYPWADEDPLGPPQTIVASAAFADGSLTVAAQPKEPCQLQVATTDDNNSISAGLVTLTGTDPEGAALVATVDLAVDGKWWRPLGCFKTLTSAVITGTVGATAADTIRIAGGVQRWQQQNRMIRDVIRAVGYMKQMSDAPCSLGFVTNVQLVDIDRNSRGPDGWTLAMLHLTINYSSDRLNP